MLIEELIEKCPKWVLVSRNHRTFPDACPFSSCWLSSFYMTALISLITFIFHKYRENVKATGKHLSFITYHVFVFATRLQVFLGLSHILYQMFTFSMNFPFYFVRPSVSGPDSGYQLVASSYCYRKHSVWSDS